MNIKSKIKKHKKLYSILLWVQTILRSIYYGIFLSLFRLIPINPKKIVITSYRGKGYGDMAKYIVEEQIKKNDGSVIYWGAKKQYKSSLPETVKFVRYDSILYLYHLATAKVWINNTRFHYGIIKRKNQYYIQTWHGGIGLKKIEADAINDLHPSYILAAKKDSKMINLLLSNSDYSTKQYRSNFWYDGEIAEIGLPRNDIFFYENKNVIAKIKNKYGISEDDKIIMYAPTFRTYEFDYFSIDFEKLCSKMTDEYKTKYKVIVRLHPNVNKIITNSENVIDVTSYPDADELLLIADILISDYSSIFFDFLFTKKDVYLYAPDAKDYISNRGLNFEYFQLPFCISTNNNELIDNILNNKAREYDNDLQKFLKDLNVYDDGTASKKVVDIIDKKLK